MIRFCVSLLDGIFVIRRYLAKTRLKRWVEYCKARHSDRRGRGNQNNPRHTHQTNERHHLTIRTCARVPVFGRACGLCLWTSTRHQSRSPDCRSCAEEVSCSPVIAECGARDSFSRVTLRNAVVSVIPAVGKFE